MVSYPFGGWTSFFKAIGWSIAFLLIGVSFSIIFGVGNIFLLERSGVVGIGDGTNLPVLLLLQGVSTLAGFGLATWIIAHRVMRLRARTIGWASGRAARRGFLLGLLCGVVPAVAALTLGAAAGGAAWVRSNGTIGTYVLVVLQTILFLAPAAFSEEILFRGLPLVLLDRSLGRGAAILSYSACVFALAHARNPDVTPLAIANIALAGILLGLVFYTAGGIWASFGAHLGWNATLAASGAPVSGLPLPIPLLDYRPGHPDWLAGGRFGPEGGILAGIALIGASVVAARWAIRDNYSTGAAETLRRVA
ncbi:MAG: type II CAAX endopeptidase family protein [Gemmatimonadota bacterium]